MAAARWAKDRERRDRLALLTAEQYPNRIVRRIIVVDREKDVREAVIWDWDSAREARRKVRRLKEPDVKGPGKPVRPARDRTMNGFDSNHPNGVVKTK
jgi:hypothetical protein